MEKQVSRRNKRYKAKRLFFTKKYTSAQICEMVDVTAATMSKWIKRYGWKKPDEAGLRVNVKVFGIISQEFNQYLELNAPQLHTEIIKAIKSYVKSTSGNAAKISKIKAEIKAFFDYPELIGQAFDGITVNQVDELSFNKLEELLAMLKGWDHPTIELTIKKVNP